MEFFTRIAERARGTQPLVHPPRTPHFPLEGGQIEKSVREEPDAQSMVQRKTVGGESNRGLSDGKPLQPKGSLGKEPPLSIPEIHVPMTRGDGKESGEMTYKSSTDSHPVNVEHREGLLPTPTKEGKRTERSSLVQTRPIEREKLVHPIDGEKKDTSNSPKESVSEVPERRPQYSQPPYASRQNLSEPKKFRQYDSTPSTIKVTIGRVEVRAIQEPAPAPKRKVSQAKPPLSLATYLEQRKRGER